jgi:myo-inositol-1(or 4)-monophosphatase
MFGVDELDRLANAAEVAARAGGEIVAAHFGRARDVREKSPGDWVSAADEGSEHAVREMLERLAPGIAFFGEEFGGDRADVGWYCDPLDGTANFLHGLEAVGVSIALVADGRPVVGVVHVPMLARTYRATLGGGAFRDDAPIRVSDRDPERAIAATGFPFRHPQLRPRYLRALTAALDTCEDLRRVGAASLDLCWTAEGVFDGYFELALGTWDVAAGALIVREAGGVVTDWAGDPDAWLWSGDIVSGPPQVHARLLALCEASTENREIRE